MKKSLYYMFAAATLMGFAACDEGDYADWVEPVANPQEDVLPSATERIADGIGDAAEIQLAQSGTAVQVFTPTSTEYPTTYTVNFENGKSLVAGADGTVSTEELQAVLVSLYGKAPVVREVPATVVALSEVGGVSVKTTKAVTIKAQPISPDVEEAYYLVLNDAEMVLEHNDAKSRWDDPVFTLTFEATADAEWYVKSESGKVFGFDIPGDTTTDGVMKADGEAGSLESEGKHKLTFNAETFSYSMVELLFVDYIYVPGNAQDWKPETAPALQHQGEGLYTGFAYMDGKFKFTQERTWEAAQYNNGSFKTASEGFDLGAMDGGDIKCTEAGVYYFEVNVATGDLKATLVTCMGLSGKFNGWDADDEMTWDAENLCYVKEGATVTPGWKFRVNNGWDINFGGNINNLVFKGADIEAVGTTIKLYPCRTTSENIYCTVE